MRAGTLWRLALGFILLAATITLIAFGIVDDSVPRLIGGISGCVFVAFYYFIVMLPWFRRPSLPLHP